MPKTKKEKMHGFKCQSNDHLSRDYTMVHFCYICNNFKHAMFHSPILKQPWTSTSFCVQGSNASMFIQIPKHVCKDIDASPSASPIALVTVSGGELPAMVLEAEIARIVRTQTQWKWEAILHGKDAFWCHSPPLTIFAEWLT